MGNADESQDWEEDVAECADCGVTLAPEDPSFAFGTRGVLCLECALRRGGEYAGDEDRWIVAPDLTGLSVQAAEP
jgi:hypothetical protein